MRVHGRAKSNFAAQHINAAKYFADKIREIEQRYSSAEQPEVVAPQERNYYWVSTILLSVASLEANIYDLFTDEYRGILVSLDQAEKQRILETLTKTKPILDQYDIGMNHIIGQKLDSGKDPIQSVSDLIALRNELTHYKSEWRDDAKISQKLEARLKRKFKLNEFRCGSVFFPERCVSYESARWAVKTSLEFMKDYSAKLGLPCLVA